MGKKGVIYIVLLVLLSSFVLADFEINADENLLRSDFPNTEFSNVGLSVGTFESDDGNALSYSIAKFSFDNVYFDVSEIEKAEIVIEVKSGSVNPLELQVSRITEDWNRATFQNTPTYASPTGTIHLEETANYFVDITDLVQDWMTTGHNYGIIIKEENENINTISNKEIEVSLKLTFTGCGGCPDVNHDRAVNIIDLVTTSTNLFSGNLNYDLNDDGKVRLGDVVCVSRSFGVDPSTILRCNIKAAPSTTITLTYTKRTDDGTEQQGTGRGIEPPINTENYGKNYKDKTKYSKEEVFIMNSQDWKTKLPWVSAAIWTPISKNENKENLAYEPIPRLEMEAPLAIEFEIKEPTEIGSMSYYFKQQNFDPDTGYEGWIHVDIIKILSNGRPELDNNGNPRKYILRTHKLIEREGIQRGHVGFDLKFLNGLPTNLITLQPGIYRMRVYVPGFENRRDHENIPGTKNDALMAEPLWGFLHKGEIDENGVPDNDYYFIGRIHSIKDSKGQIISEIDFDENKHEPDSKWCNLQKHKDRQVYDYDVETCVYPLLVYHEDVYEYTNVLKKIYEAEKEIKDYDVQGDKIAFISIIKVGTEEKDQVFYIDRTTGEIHQVTNIEDDGFEGISIYGNKILWRGFASLFMCEIDKNGQKGGCLPEDEKIRLNFDFGEPSPFQIHIEGNKLFWSEFIFVPNENRGASSSYIGEIKMCDLALNGQKGGCLTADEKTKIHRPEIDVKTEGGWFKIEGDEILYFKGKDLRRQNLLTGDTQTITGLKDFGWIDISKNHIIWADRERNGQLSHCNLNLNGQKGGCLEEDEEKQLTDMPTEIYSLKIWVEDESITDLSGKVHLILNFPAKRIYEYTTPGIEEKDTETDIDSLLAFLKEYQPSRITTLEKYDFILWWYINSEINMDENRFRETNLEESYLQMWSEYESIVYVKDDYTKGLIAASFASLINSPLIVEGSVLDKESTFEDKRKICIGFTSPPMGCADTFTLNEAIEEYKRLTNTNRIIMVNPFDEPIFSRKGITSTSSNDEINFLYGGHSLLTPIISSTKHQLILPVTGESIEEIDTSFKNQLQEYYSELYSTTGITQNREHYLTVLGSPHSIPHKELRKYSLAIARLFAKIAKSPRPSEITNSADAAIYADINEDEQPDLSVGRMTGLTVTDVSSHFYRGIYFDKFSKSNDILVLSSDPGKGWADWIVSAFPQWSLETAKLFSFSNYPTQRINQNQDQFKGEGKDWEGKQLIHYLDHGSNSMAGIGTTEIPKLDNSLIFTSACSTCETANEESFCHTAIRKGASMFLGATSMTFGIGNTDRKMISKIYHDGKPLGLAYKESTIINKDQGMRMLIGDPTLNIEANPRLVRPLVED